MSDKPKLQVNFKDGRPDLVNVYADSPQELEALLIGLKAAIPTINSVYATEPVGLAALDAAGVGYTHVEPPSNVVQFQPQHQQAFAPPAPQAPPSGPACAHGARSFKEGTNKAGKPYKGWFCPSNADGCTPQWVR